MNERASLLRRSVTPADLRSAGAVTVSGAARLDGRRGDVVCTVDIEEHERRAQVGLGAVLSGADLETLFGLPLDEPVAEADLAAWEVANLRSAPHGTVDMVDGAVTRRVTQVLEVHAVLVSGRALHPLLSRLGPFRRASQCIAHLPAAPRDLDRCLWEADAAGVGVWIGDDPVEVLRPDVFAPEALTSGRWRFNESVYDRWLAAIGAMPASPASAGLHRNAEALF